MEDSWKVTEEGEHYIIRILLPSGEHIEYELPHMPVSRPGESVTQFWWEWEGHVYSLVIPARTMCEVVVPRRFEDEKILSLIDEAKAAWKRG